MANRLQEDDECLRNAETKPSSYCRKTENEIGIRLVLDITLDNIILNYIILI